MFFSSIEHSTNSKTKMASTNRINVPCAEFRGYVFDPVSNHIGVCIYFSKIPDDLNKEQKKKQSLLRKIQNKIKGATKPTLSHNIRVQVSATCVTKWSHLTFGDKINVILEIPKETRVDSLGYNRSSVLRYTPFTLVEIKKCGKIDK